MVFCALQWRVKVPLSVHGLKHLEIVSKKHVQLNNEKFKRARKDPQLKSIVGLGNLTKKEQLHKHLQCVLFARLKLMLEVILPLNHLAVL